VNRSSTFFDAVGAERFNLINPLKLPFKPRGRIICWLSFNRPTFGLGVRTVTRTFHRQSMPQ
jgi:hypothetical protein